MKKGIIFLILIFFTACVPALYRPTDENAALSGIKLEDLKHGRQLYVDHCGSCHQLHLPRQYSESRWKVILDLMRTRSHITPDEQELIFKFVKAGL